LLENCEQLEELFDLTNIFANIDQVILHKLAHLREKNQPPREFRRLMHELTLLVG
jgi:uracil phosphoribosyltransferase